MPHLNQTRENSRILIVDDLESNRKVIRRRLEKQGYKVEEAASGEEALKMINRSAPDLVLLDYMMPGMSGADVFRILRKEWKLTNLPVIMLTARTEADTQAAALRAGIDDYVTKPINISVLDARIQTQLQKYRAEDALRNANQTLGNRAAIQALSMSELEQELRREFILRQKRAEDEEEDLRAGSSAYLKEAYRLLRDVITNLEGGHPPKVETLKAILNTMGNGLADH